MNSKEQIILELEKAFAGAGFELEQPVHIEHPQDMSHGDWACTSALAYAKQNGLNPQDVAKQVVENITSSKVQSVEVAGPGFINITLDKKYWISHMQSTQEDSWGTTESLVGKKWLVEHTQPNLFKPFHIGHLVNNAMGNSLSQIFRSCGAEILELSFPSDIGPGIAKAVWGLMDKGWFDNFTIQQIGEAYAHGSTQYKEDEKVKEVIDTFNKHIYKRVPSPELDLYDKGIKFSLDYFRDIVKKLGTEFDGIIFETESEVKGKELVNENMETVFEESEGAIIFRGSEYGLYDSVFINSAGFGTYLAKDLGLIWHKWDRYSPFDKSVYVTDIEQKQHFQLVAKAAGMINQEWEDKSLFLQHGRLSLTSGKISSREGNVPLAEDLINEVEQRVLEKMTDRNIPEDEKQHVAEVVTIGALRYALLKTSAGKNIVFDFEQSLSFEGDSGPYIQYTYVRTQSILEKVGELPKFPSGIHGNVPEVARLLERFPEAIEKSLCDFSPHHIANYVYDLASSFNSFYAETKIADESNPDFAYNIYLTQSVGDTLQKGLALLGIGTVEKM